MPLTRGLVALVDDEDLPLIAGRRWKAHNGYAQRTEIDGSTSLMHRLILGLSRRDGFQVDHRNGNGLDNRRVNLRVATNAQNQQNVRADRAGPTRSSRHRGVSWNTRYERWIATAKLDGQQHYLGAFTDEDEAAKTARDFRAEHMPFCEERETV